MSLQEAAVLLPGRLRTLDQIHRKVWELFPDQPHRDYIFTWAPSPDGILAVIRAPSLAAIHPPESWAVPFPRDGESHSFRLLCCPMRSSSRGNGNKVAVHSAPLQIEWLREREEALGCRFDMIEVRDSAGVELKLGAIARYTVFEGCLTITNAEAFGRIMTHGFGQRKAYGMGMFCLQGTPTFELMGLH